MVERVRDLVAQNPFLMTKEQQEQKKKSGGEGPAAAEESKGGKKGAMKPIAKKGAKPIDERLDDIEQQLASTQWIGGHKLSSLDKDALEEILAAGGVSIVSPLTMPATFAWYAIVSKFAPEKRANWPKMKAPAQEKHELKQKLTSSAEKQVEFEHGGKLEVPFVPKKGTAHKPLKHQLTVVSEEAADFDPFAEVDDAEAEAAAASMKAKAEAAKAAKKKAAPIAKSIIVWEVKPWGPDTDLDEMAR